LAECTASAGGLNPSSTTCSSIQEQHVVAGLLAAVVVREAEVVVEAQLLDHTLLRSAIVSAGVFTHRQPGGGSRRSSSHTFTLPASSSEAPLGKDHVRHRP
jgi:predicted transporter